mmetsp:Transcript_12008/g.30439  ORF Transcript_12008/g.30439 Transcript_12008/m.30439 type:complete len:250 (+) Transcript_12008:100-849(+)
MKFALSLLALAASASAFAPNTPSFRNNALRMSEEAVEEVAAEPEEEVVEAPPAPAGPVKVPLSGKSPFPDIFLGESVWDKLTMEWGSEETGKFIRAAELKHGRSAMLATVGYSFHKLGLTFDKISVHEYLSPTQDIKFADLAAMSPVDAMKSLPAESWLQMFAFCGIIEIYEMTHVGGKIAYDETVAPGLQPGGLTGDLGWNPLQITIDERRQTVELQNGRAAMFAISAWLAAETIPGSMPLFLPWAKP